MPSIPNTFTLLVVVFAFLSLTDAVLYRKHLAGPPSEFSNHVLPSPEDAAVSQRSAVYEIKLTPKMDGSSSIWADTLAIDSTTFFSFSVLSPVESKLKVSLVDPAGREVDLEPHKVSGDLSSFPIGLGNIPGTTYAFEPPFLTGIWIISVESSEAIEPRSDSEANGLVILFNESPVRAHTYVASYSLKKGSEIGLVTRLTMDSEDVKRPQALRDVITKALIEVQDPNGGAQVIPMHDDGLHYDGEANDGVWGGYMVASEDGIYRMEALVEAVVGDGITMARSTQHLLPIIDPAVSLAGRAFIAPKDNTHVDIMIVVNQEAATDSFRAYTELWGKGANGEDVPICWLAGIVDVQEVQGESVVALELDTQWIQKAGAQTPFTLKNVLFQDINVYVPIDESTEISVEGSLPRVPARMDLPITKEMRRGVFPQELLVNDNATAAPTLLLLHGYCSDVNPWEKSASSFKDAAYFLAKSSSLTHEQFAQKVIQYVQSLGMTRWGGIGHSQGGSVLAHLLTYYFSGLDQSSNGRVIQSVGSPYQGNSGAGTAANLIKIFGFGCGENFDLTTDGSKLWMVGIPTYVRQQVNYYTTTYKQGQFFGDYCNLLVNALLKWPNDGTCEEQLSDLKGGIDRGNKEAWCHTTDMKYTAQYYDQARNQEMNDAAAR